MMKPTVRGVCCVAGLVACCAAIGASQPEKPALKEAAKAAPEDERGALRVRLERRLDETKRVQARLEGAIKRLDEGAPAEAVKSEMEPERGRGDGSRRDGRGRHDGPGGPDRMGPDRTDRPRLEKGEVLDFIRKNNPEMASRLEQALKDNPPVGERIIGRWEPQVRELLAERDPEVRELRVAEMSNGFETIGAMRELGEALRAGRPAPELESKLRGLIGKHYDLQLRLREKEIARLEERLKQLREEVGEKQPQREAFIDQRMEQIKKRAMERRGPGESPKGEGPKAEGAKGEGNAEPRP